MLFDIKPEQIVFTYENENFSTTNLKMTNRSSSKIAFKVNINNISTRLNPQIP